MRTGVRLAVDVGSVRIGVARSDASATLAVPVETVKADARAPGRIAEIVQEYEAIEVYVGHPLSLSGAPGRAAELAVEFAELLNGTVDVPVRLVDERLSTVSASAALRDAGRDTRRGRSVIDQAAAVIVLQHAIDQERVTGLAPGAALHELGEQ